MRILQLISQRCNAAGKLEFEPHRRPRTRILPKLFQFLVDLLVRRRHLAVIRTLRFQTLVGQIAAPTQDRQRDRRGRGASSRGGSCSEIVVRGELDRAAFPSGLFGGVGRLGAEALAAGRGALFAAASCGIRGGGSGEDSAGDGSCSSEESMAASARSARAARFASGWGASISKSMSSEAGGVSGCASASSKSPSSEVRSAAGISPGTLAARIQSASAPRRTRLSAFKLPRRASRQRSSQDIGPSSAPSTSQHQESSRGCFAAGGEQPRHVPGTQPRTLLALANLIISAQVAAQDALAQVFPCHGTEFDAKGQIAPTFRHGLSRTQDKDKLL